jgi:hypothetical protein
MPTPEAQRKRKMAERRAYVVLVLISVFLSLASTVFAVHRADQDGKKFCDIIGAAIAKPVPQPKDPKKDPSRERAYEYYLRFKTLDQRLGC